jgi:pimeloyl-ACP methyl ester carboxylesterase
LTQKRETKPPPHLREPVPQVSGAWLLRWFLIAVLAAGACGYLTMCLLFYQGQWQLVFHPSRSITTTPASLGVGFDDVRFDYTETGVAQLDGWWIPAPGTSARQPWTVLFLHDGRGSLSDSAAQLKGLHSLGVNLFAIDYRGFGQSLNTHPSEQGVYQDADAAIAYLTQVRHADPQSIVVYGVGLGAVIAAETARRHPEMAGLVLENPSAPALALVERDPRTRLLPVRWLFRDRFELEPKLRGLVVPTLMLRGNDIEATRRFLDGLRPAK